MKQKKFWQKLIGSLLAILLIVPFSFINAKAQTLNTNYSLTQYNYYNSLSSGDNPASFICVNFKKPATGTLTITATGIGSVSGSNNVYLVNVISGGNLTKINTNNFTVSLTGSDNVQILVEGNPLVTTATFLTYTMSFSGSYIDNETVSLDNIDANVVTISGQVTDAVTILGQINTKLASLSVQDYTTILNTINSSIGSVETAIGNIPDYTSVLNSINSYLNTVNTNIADIETICSGIQSTVNSILSTLNNIDNLIDTITWRDQTSGTGFKGYSLDGYTIQQISNNISVPYDSSVYLHFTTNGYSAQSLYRFIIPFSYGNLSFRYQKPKIEAYLLNGSSLVPVLNYELYSFTMAYRTYIYYEGASFSSTDLVFKVTTPNSGYLYNGISDVGYKYIYSTDIEYWKIKSSLQAQAYYQGTNESQNAINQQQSTNQNFESQSNQYHNLESTFQSNFDSAMDAINPSDFTSAIALFYPAFRWFTDQLGNLYDASGNFKILFTLPLILGIALFFIGRGAQAMQHAEHVQNVKSYQAEMSKYRSETLKYQKHIMDYHNSRSFGWEDGYDPSDSWS